MPEPVKLQALKQKGDTRENEKIAKIFEDAARRARKGEFKSACWCAYGREDYAALFGWQKFGAMVPLIGAVTIMQQEMCNSPIMNLTELEDVDDTEVGPELDGGGEHPLPPDRA